MVLPDQLARDSANLLPYLHFENVSFDAASDQAESGDDSLDDEDDLADEAAETPSQDARSESAEVLQESSFKVGPGNVCLLVAGSVNAARDVLDLASGAKRPQAGRVVRCGTILALHRIRIFSNNEASRLTVMERLEMFFALSGWHRSATRKATVEAANSLGSPLGLLQQGLSGIGRRAFIRLCLFSAMRMEPDILLVDGEILRDLSEMEIEALATKFRHGGGILVIGTDVARASKIPINADLILSPTCAQELSPEPAKETEPTTVPLAWTHQASCQVADDGVLVQLRYVPDRSVDIDSLSARLSKGDTRLADVACRPQQALVAGQPYDAAFTLPMATNTSGRFDLAVSLLGWEAGATLLAVQRFKLLLDGTARPRLLALSDVLAIDFVWAREIGRKDKGRGDPR